MSTLYWKVFGTFAALVGTFFLLHVLLPLISFTWIAIVIACGAAYLVWTRVAVWELQRAVKLGESLAAKVKDTIQPPPKGP